VEAKVGAHRGRVYWLPEPFEMDGEARLRDLIQPLRAVPGGHRVLDRQQPALEQAAQRRIERARTRPVDAGRRGIEAALEPVTRVWLAGNIAQQDMLEVG
jgi:hypothetical protein